MLAYLLAFAFLGSPFLSRGTGSDADLHPAGALVYIELPDLPALRTAYGSAPLLRLLSDPQVDAFAASVAKRDAADFDLRDEIGRGIEQGLDRLEPSLAACIRSLDGVRSLSVSISGTPPGAPSDTASGSEERSISFEARLSSIGALLALELPSPEAAQRVESQWMKLLERVEGQADDSSRASDERVHRIALKALGPDASIWMLAEGERLFVGYGSDRPEELDARRAGKSPALSSDAHYREGHGRFADGEGATVYEAHLRLDGLAHALFGGGLALPTEARSTLTALSSSLLPGDDFEADRRTRLVGGRFVTESFRRAAPESSQGLFAAIGAAPVPRAALLAIPTDAVAGWATSVDSERLARDLGALVAEATGKPLEESLASVRERFGFDPLADLVGSLGSRASFYCLPISGLTLPKVHLVVELRDPQAFERGLQGLGRVLTSVSEGEIEVGDRPYRNMPLYSFSPRRNLGELAGNYGAPQQVVSLVPSFVSAELAVAIVEGRAVFGIGRIPLRHELKRLLAEPDTALAPVLAKEGAFPADATSVSFVDWGRILRGLYETALPFLPMIAQATDAPQFDPNALPDPALFTNYFAPTLSWTRDVPGGTLSVSDSAFGPEVPLALALGGALGAAFESNVQHDAAASMVVVHPIEEAVPPPDEPTPQAEEDPISRTRKTLRDVKLALVVYKTDRGRYPAELDRLFDATDRFPQGFLEGTSPVIDAWGRTLRYRALEQGASFRAWSVGPDGVDADGGGDDLPIE